MKGKKKTIDKTKEDEEEDALPLLSFSSSWWQNKIKNYEATTKASSSSCSATDSKQTKQEYIKYSVKLCLKVFETAPD